jgi:hypothetical protein
MIATGITLIVTGVLTAGMLCLARLIVRRTEPHLKPH